MESKLSLAALRDAVALKERIIEFETRLSRLLSGVEQQSEGRNGTQPDRRQGKRSIETRRKMAAAQRARWAKKKAGTA